MQEANSRSMIALNISSGSLLLKTIDHFRYIKIQHGSKA